jgi:TonB family protein
MLVWSGVLHITLFLTFFLAGRLRGTEPPFELAADTIWIAGDPGQMPGLGGGGAPSPPPPKAPEPPEPAEPEKPEPRVVRPTKEDRDQLPMPDAKETRRKKKPPKPSSGLTGRDSASADSAKLKGAGMPGLGLGGGGGSGFDQDFEYSYYAQQMISKIYQHWQQVPVRGEAIAVIRFTIFKDGHLENIGVEKSSGIAMLDRAAQRAIFLSDPLPPLPDTYPRDRVGVHLQFVYSEQN